MLNTVATTQFALASSSIDNLNADDIASLRFCRRAKNKKMHCFPTCSHTFTHFTRHTRLCMLSAALCYVLRYINRCARKRTQSCTNRRQKKNARPTPPHIQPNIEEQTWAAGGCLRNVRPTKQLPPIFLYQACILSVFRMLSFLLSVGDAVLTGLNVWGGCVVPVGR